MTTATDHKVAPSTTSLIFEIFVLWDLMKCYESLIRWGIQSRDSGAAMANASVWFASIPRKVPRVGQLDLWCVESCWNVVFYVSCWFFGYPVWHVNPSILIYDFAVWSHQTGNLNRFACPKKYGGWALFKSETLGFQDLFVVGIFGTWWSYMIIYSVFFNFDVISFHGGTRKPQLFSHPPTIWSKKVWECLNSSFVAASWFP